MPVDEKPAARHRRAAGSRPGEAVASVGSRGDSYDNAMAEAFNSLFKGELIHNPAQLPVLDWLLSESVLPGGEDVDAGWLEVDDVAGDDLELVGEGGGGEEAVGGVDGGARGVGTGE
jgi:transposase InsO family protein